MSSEERTIGVPREAGGETRVALVPAVLSRLKEAGFEVVVAAGAGEAAGFADDAYEAHGARIGTQEEARAARIVVGIRVCGANQAAEEERAGLRSDSILVGIADALSFPRSVAHAADTGATVFALDLLPRISRAQAMDVLSSQATVTGYKAALLVAGGLPKMFPMLTTAAGTLPPAEVLVVGAGVAGLMAIATARRMGAVVQAYDVRAAAQDEIESVGARAVLLPLAPGDAADASGYAKELGETFYLRQQELLAQVVANVDGVITTAAIPGKPAPVLITDAAVAGMRTGSIIVDCAAERGGNCAGTRPDETVRTDNGVTIFGPTNLAGTVPRDASQMFAKNVTAFLTSVLGDPEGAIDLDDDVVKGTMVAREGKVLHERVQHALEELDQEENADATTA